jgi:hypothetical protein
VENTGYILFNTGKDLYVTANGTGGETNDPFKALFFTDKEIAELVRKDLKEMYGEITKLIKVEKTMKIIEIESL